MDKVVYAVVTNSVRMANNILSDTAGNYVKKMSPETKDAFAKVLADLLDLQGALCKENIDGVKG